MQKLQFTILVLFIFVHLHKSSGLAPFASGCENDSWYTFNDEKCVKVIVDQLVSHDNALKMCREFGEDGSLLKINSEDEQNFLAKLIFEDNQIVDGVWLGAVRKLDSSTEFEWDDKSPFRYTKWAEGSPSGDFEKNCTQLTSHLGMKEGTGPTAQDGLWMDVSCLKRNLVVCQKRQNWSISEIENAFFEMRYLLADVKKENAQLQAQLDAVHLNQSGDIVNLQNCMEFQISENFPDALSSRFVLRNKKFVIYPLGVEQPKEVQCDFETDGGGWTVIQQRSSGPLEEFYRGWSEYEEGFGDVDGNYWIGLKTIHALTNAKPQELRIELEDWEGNIRFAKYNSFFVGSSSDLYRLQLGAYSGNANDSLTWHNGMNFSTFDRDNDADSGRHCAQTYHGAWWYNACHNSNLNGYYFVNGSTPGQDGIVWRSFKGLFYSLKNVAMKIRDVLA